MDPLTHAAVPAAALLLARRSRREAVLAGMGGLLPDIEKGVQGVLLFLPGSHSLHFQHGGTHSLLGAALVAGAGACFMARDRGAAFTALLMGTWSHVLLDLLNHPWAVRPFLPLSAWAVPLQEIPGSPWIRLALLGLAGAVLAAGWRRIGRSPDAPDPGSLSSDGPP